VTKGGKKSQSLNLGRGIGTFCRAAGNAGMPFFLFNGPLFLIFGNKDEIEKT